MLIQLLEKIRINISWGKQHNHVINHKLGVHLSPKMRRLLKLRPIFNFEAELKTVP